VCAVVVVFVRTCVQTGSSGGDDDGEEDDEEGRR
jgi:hypothetical protein